MAMLNNQRVPILTGEETLFLVNYSSRWCFQPSCMNEMYTQERQPKHFFLLCLVVLRKQTHILVA